MSGPKLTRVIAEHKKTVRFMSVHRQFTRMSDRYRSIRDSTGGFLLHCFWCRRKFEDGDAIALGIRTRGGHVSLCDKCACKALGEELC